MSATWTWHGSSLMEVSGNSAGRLTIETNVSPHNVSPHTLFASWSQPPHCDGRLRPRCDIVDFYLGANRTT
jgi:hypothetical protein